MIETRSRCRWLVGLGLGVALTSCAESPPTTSEHRRASLLPEPAGALAFTDDGPMAIPDGSDDPDGCLRSVSPDEPSAEAIVQIVAFESDADGEHQHHRLDARRMREIDRSYPLCDHVWKEHQEEFTVFPSCSGAVMAYGDRRKGDRIITAAHCLTRLVGNSEKTLHAIAARTVAADPIDGSNSELDNLYHVECIERYHRSPEPTGVNPKPENPDVMILRLDRQVTTAEGEPVKPLEPREQPLGVADTITALFHPLGLPMQRTSPPVSVECEGQLCWARFDNAQGGSGGAVFDAANRLVGVVYGDVGFAYAEGADCPHFPADKIQPFTPVHLIRGLENGPVQVGPPLIKWCDP